MTWQPISTAPKDGTRFLTYDGESVRENCWFNYDVFGLFPGSQEYCRWLIGSHETPTDWMPLPDPPETER